jgi:hypothetical protein
MQRIKIINTLTAAPVTLTVTDVILNDFNDLKRVILSDVSEFRGYNFDNARVVIKKQGQEPKTLSLGEQTLFEGDFTVFVTPTKVSQGTDLEDLEKVLRNFRSNLLDLIDELGNTEEAVEEVIDCITDLDLPEAPASESQSNLTAEEVDLMQRLR